MAAAIELADEFSCLQTGQQSDIKIIPPSPGPGQLGITHKFKVKTNFFKLQLKSPTLKVYHYDIEIFTALREGGDREGPEMDINSKRYKKLRLKSNLLVFEKFVDDNSGPGQLFWDPEKQNTILPAFDGIKNVYTSRPLVGKLLPITQKIKIDIDGRSVTYKVVLKHTPQAIEMGQLQTFHNSEKQVPIDCVQVLDIVLRYGPLQNMVPIAKSLFKRHDQDRNRLTLKSEMAQEKAEGIYISAHALKNTSVVQLDRSLVLFHKESEVETFLKNSVKIDDLGSSEMRSRVCREGSRAIKGLEVKVNHLTYARKYKIKDITTESARELIITISKEGEPDRRMSIVEYFFVTYQRKINPYLPCLVAGSNKRPNYLPMDLCRIVGDQPVVHVSPKATQELIRISAQIKPQDRMKNLISQAASFRDLSRKYRDEFGLQVAGNSMTSDARVLDPPTLEYGRGKKMTPVDGSWRMSNLSFFEGPTIKANEWMIMTFARNPQRAILDAFCSKLAIKAKAMGLNIQHDRSVVLHKQEYQPGTIEELFKKKHREFKNKGSELKLIFCVLVKDLKSKRLYEELKYAGDVQTQIVTQCVLDCNLNKDSKFVENLVLKLNAKLGGVNSKLAAVTQPNVMAPEMLRNNRVMTVGISLTHPSDRSGKNAQTVSAIAASLDNGIQRWTHAIRVHDEDVLVGDLTGMFEEIFEYYLANDEKFPDKVIVYRDGISEAQFKRVVDNEVMPIKKAFYNVNAKCTSTQEPEIYFIVALRNHRTRFVPEDPNYGRGPVGNIPPGTVVDVEVTTPNSYNFFLNSHLGIQGLSRPIHYFVIYADGQLLSDEIQTLTNYLAYCSARCTSSTSLPVPLVYANLLAERGRAYFNTSKDYIIQAKAGIKDPARKLFFV